MAIDNDDSLIEEASTYVEDIKDVEDITEENFNSIVSHVEAHFTKAKTYRNVEERRWLRAYRNYRGLYGPDVMFTETEKSRVFIKVTKTKTLAAYGQIVDVLFGNQTFPIIIDPTILPEGVSGSVHFDPALPDEMRKEGEEDADVPEDSPYGFAGDGKDLKPGATERTLSLGALEKKLGDIDGVKEGQGVTPTSVTFYPAQVAAKKMQKKILNQLEECHASKHLRSTAFEMSLFGTGILKGPFAVNKEFPDWDLEGNYNPLIKTVPQVSHVSIWNLYPDPDASNMEEAEYVIERHKLSRSQLRALKKRPFFRGNVIEASIKQGESYVKQWWEDDLADYEQQHSIERFEVLEYWGVMDAEFAREAGLDRRRRY